MNIKSELTKSRFLSKVDVEPPITATIGEVVREKIVVPGERPETKYCVYFKEANVKPLILNKTNGDKIAAIAGSYETDDWLGVKVELYLEPNVDFAGQLTGGMRVRAPKTTAAIKARVPALPQEDEAEEEVKAHLQDVGAGAHGQDDGRGARSFPALLSRPLRAGRRISRSNPTRASLWQSAHR
jgi:hypothetical protein